MQAAKPTGCSHPYVERRPGVCGGEPVVVGTRFPVRSVVTSVYRLGMTPEEMVEAWPYLTLAHIHDALSFYHDHRRTIDRAIRENRETVVRKRAGDLDGDRKPRRRLDPGRP
jgi:uncharacterized protein (DUF433 family)